MEEEYFPFTLSEEVVRILCQVLLFGHKRPHLLSSSLLDTALDTAALPTLTSDLLLSQCWSFLKGLFGILTSFLRRTNFRFLLFGRFSNLLFSFPGTNPKCSFSPSCR